MPALWMFEPTSTTSTTTLTIMSSVCRVCTTANTGECLNNRCRCYEGFLGITCSDRPTSPRPLSNTTNHAIAVTAGVLGGLLIAAIIGLAIYFWRKRSKHSIPSHPLRESNRTTLTTVPSTEPIVVPALYSAPSVAEYSSNPSFDTISYHLYEEANISQTEN